MSFTVKDLMLVRETDPKRMGGFSINNGHLQCVVDPQGVGIRNKLSNIDLRHFVVRPMPRKRASSRMRSRC